ncbi:MAG TPA: XkdF-like putative serine protease domain-containing protein [Candidatus Binatia bacterium]|nr:XkdF-like putative serine protease domain-containing protein [Candidatus Binatia bacterium]
MPDKLLKFFQLLKVDEAAHMVWGIATSEAPDAEDEICDYAAAKADIKRWSDEQFAKTTAAGQDPSLGNIRVMHQLQIGGKAIKIQNQDESKQVWLGSEPADDQIWHLLKGGFLTGYSIGGTYAWKRAEGKYTRYAPIISEISYVDKQSNPEASFAYVKADGTTELRKFAKPGPAEQEMLAKLRKTGLEALSEADVDRIVKAIRSGLSTELEKFSVMVSEVVAKPSGTGGSMNPEQIKKCAAALGISEEEFKKQFIDGDALEKGKKGLAALHAHLKKAISHHTMMSAHHDKLAAMHKDHGEHHATMADHLENCMKAHGACMDGEEADKILKALGAGLTDDFVLIGKTADGVEVFKKKAPASTTAPVVTVPPAGGLDEAKIADLVAKAVKAELDKMPEPSRGSLFSVTREGEVKKAETATRDPLPV